jgi:2-keto-4-pentenoate hydratase/2-oxohepta-3-ene-1,7-dioic acid hydratase in catechol pathway
MKYQIFTYLDANEAPKAGIAIATSMFDLHGLCDAAAIRGIGTLGIDAMLEDWSTSHAALKRLAESVSGGAARFGAYRLDAGQLRFAPPLLRPGTIYAAGANYRDHVEAMAKAFNMKLVLDPRAEGVPPWHFIKAARGTLVGHKQPVAYPAHTKMLDWEAELAVVIGRRARNVTVASALDSVAGYTCANDLSARDNLQRPQVDASSPFRFDWIGHKCFTGACPLGPFLTPAEFVPSPENLGIKLWRNGEIKQDSNTHNHLYGVAEQIAYLSERLELFPGDVLLTGTPAGVGMETGTFLARGDVLKVWIEGLGELETPIV